MGFVTRHSSHGLENEKSSRFLLAALVEMTDGEFLAVLVEMTSPNSLLTQTHVFLSTALFKYIPNSHLKSASSARKIGKISVNLLMLADESFSKLRRQLPNVILSHSIFLNCALGSSHT